MSGVRLEAGREEEQDEVKVVAEFTINVWDLFVHDADSTHDLDERALAGLINAHFDKVLPYSERPWRVVPSDESGLDRMTLQAGEHEATRLCQKFSSRDEVRAAFPPEVATALNALNQRTLCLP